MVQIYYGVKNKPRHSVIENITTSSDQKFNDSMIHVCFGLYDKDGRYSKFTGTAMLSIFENTTSKITVHILHDNTLTQDNRDKFIYLAGCYGQTIKFYNVGEICAEKIKTFKEKIPAINSARVTIGTLYSLLVSEVIPNDIEKILYIDSDMIVNLDINDLWQIKFGDKSIASVPECEADTVFFKKVSKLHYLINEKIVTYENYFNAAIIFMNLKRLRNEQEILSKGIKWRIEHSQCICFDQDIWNYCYANDYVHLPNRFDRFVTSERAEKQPIRDVIYHFTGPNPTLDFSDELNRLYFQYFAKTPWFTKDIIKRLGESVKKILTEKTAELRILALQMTTLMSGKTRAFFIPANTLDIVKIVFKIKEYEDIIQENQESYNDLLESMESSRDKKVFFILFEDYYKLREILIQAGFVEGCDFINAMMFLPDTNGVELNTYELVRNM
ncbi:MAG: hypothetical protein IKZ58_05595 [Selenomonadaceae bacterium]|nr:hypothetical protein [Selenomonadaceae bacterium]